MGRYKDRIDARFEAQERKGIEKYGQAVPGALPEVGQERICEGGLKWQHKSD